METQIDLIVSISQALTSVPQMEEIDGEFSEKIDDGLICLIKTKDKDYDTLEYLQGYGEMLGDINGDYTIKFASKNTLSFSEEISELFLHLMDAKELILDKSIDEFSNKVDIITEIVPKLRNDIKLKYEELTDFNITKHYNNGKTKTFDYNS